jgi:hypothetical protein
MLGGAGVREIKKEKKEREMKKYFPAACCLSKGWLSRHNCSLLVNLVGKKI